MMMAMVTIEQDQNEGDAVTYRRLAMMRTYN